MPLMQRLSGTHGVGPVCRELDIAPSTYYWHQQRQLHPEKCSQREKCDAQIIQEIKRVYGENYSVYGARKVWRQLLREGFSVARCTVERLMKIIGLRGVLRGKVIKTTIGRKTAAAADLVNRQFVAERPNQLWCADFTYVSTWHGFAYVAFIIDVVRRHDRWLAGLIVDGSKVRAGCSGTSSVGTSPLRYNPSLGQGLPIRVTGVHPAAAGGGAVGVDRQYRRLLR